MLILLQYIHMCRISIFRVSLEFFLSIMQSFWNFYTKSLYKKKENDRIFVEYKQDSITICHKFWNILDNIKHCKINNIDMLKKHNYFFNKNYKSTMMKSVIFLFFSFFFANLQFFLKKVFFQTHLISFITYFLNNYGFFVLSKTKKKVVLTSYT